MMIMNSFVLLGRQLINQPLVFAPYKVSINGGSHACVQSGDT